MAKPPVRITCDRCKRDYNPVTVRTCKHPSVIKHFGTHVCMYCCRKCKFHIKNGAAVMCGYKEEN